MPKESVSSMNVDSDEEGVGQLRTVGFENMNAEDLENEELRQELRGMDKKELIKLITDMGKNELRHVNYQMSVLSERMTHFSKAIDETQKSIDEKSKKAQKYRNMGDDPDRAIKALERIIKNNKLKIKDLQKEVDKFEEKKSHKAIEQQNAKKEIDKKLTKMAYKFLEKDSDPIIVSLLETFVALLRNRPTAQREDVELYLRKHEGLLVAMNKVDPRKISGGNAAKYTECVQRIRHSFKQDNSEYRKYIPFLVFVNQTCAIVSLTVEERQFESQIEQLQQDIKDREKEIDEIETFHENVTEVIDYDEQVEQEKKQLSLFKNQYAVMKMRMDKLTRYSVMFEKYYFRDLKDKNRLRSHKLEYIDVIDDMERVKNLDEKLENINLAKSVTRIPKQEGENPLGDNKRITQLEKEKSYEGSAVDSEDEESKGSDYTATDDTGEDASASDSRYQSAIGSESYVSDSRDRSGVSDEEDSYTPSDRV